eukprot:CAMPEP_0172547066 /NCGR_PEP_ID=MMETSP1067-20121228/16688_1 /TAXON_ID=265564 ORGANISM="Thalassiosira punctigera, Strain Tpunct2005C2" /NCGR_SAMPLE_ID=MMETSP1067 /ASSEMBLY_ACC=CAM_ASM_000444 /LENGTH=52 /DNA_ID=CAMNT_0013334087 /DNA_START=127 /DNA_END=282 /DNA_ORIENTATION=-
MTNSSSLTLQDCATDRLGLAAASGGVISSPREDGVRLDVSAAASSGSIVVAF